MILKCFAGFWWLGSTFLSWGVWSSPRITMSLSTGYKGSLNALLFDNYGKLHGMVFPVKYQPCWRLLEDFKAVWVILFSHHQQTPAEWIFLMYIPPVQFQRLVESMPCWITLLIMLLHSVVQLGSAQRVTNYPPNCCYFYCPSAEFGYPFLPTYQSSQTRTYRRCTSYQWCYLFRKSSWIICLDAIAS